MKKKKWEIDRRHFLKCAAGGAGTLIGLPFLEAMLPSVKRAMAADTNPYARFVAMPWSLGAIVHSPYSGGDYFDRSLNFWGNEYYNFTGTSGTILRGNQFTLSDTLSPLNEFKSYLRLYANMSRWIGTNKEGHATELSHFLTACHTGPDMYSDNLEVGGMPNSIYKGKSMDIILSEFFQSGPNKTPMPSLHLATQRMPNAWGRCSYRAWNQPIYPERNLQTVFTSLFSGVSSTATLTNEQERIRKKKLVLDFVLGDIKSLMVKLGTEDKYRMQEYLSQIEKLQNDIDAATAPVAGCIVPSSPNFNFYANDQIVAQDRTEEHTILMLDLMIAAARCNRTRVMTYTLEPSAASVPGIWNHIMKSDSYLRKNRGWTDARTESDFNALFAGKSISTRNNYGRRDPDPKGGAGAQYGISYSGSYTYPSDVAAKMMYTYSYAEHAMSHRRQDANAAAGVAGVNVNILDLAWKELTRRKVNYVAYLAKGLSTIIDGNGKNALQNSLVLTGGGLGDPLSHITSNMPLMTIGELGGAVVGNVMQIFKKQDSATSPSGQGNTPYDSSIAVLHTKILQAFGVPIQLDQYGLNKGESVNHPARKISINLMG